jgi:hypothetical protein
MLPESPGESQGENVRITEIRPTRATAVAASDETSSFQDCRGFQRTVLQPGKAPVLWSLVGLCSGSQPIVTCITNLCKENYSGTSPPSASRSPEEEK